MVAAITIIQTVPLFLVYEKVDFFDIFFIIVVLCACLFYLSLCICSFLFVLEKKIHGNYLHNTNFFYNPSARLYIYIKLYDLHWQRCSIHLQRRTLYVQGWIVHIRHLTLDLQRCNLHLQRPHKIQR